MFPITSPYSPLKVLIYMMHLKKIQLHAHAIEANSLLKNFQINLCMNGECSLVSMSLCKTAANAACIIISLSFEPVTT